MAGSDEPAGGLPTAIGATPLAWLAAIVEASNDAILSTTPDGIITSWNPAAARLYGYSAEEAIGRPVAMLAPDRNDEVVDRLDRLRHGEPFDNFETVRVAKDGRMIEVALTGSPVRDRDGAIVGTATIVRDISARKQAEDALRASEERFVAFMEHGPMLSVIKDDELRFVYVSRTYAAGWGADAHSLIGQDDFALHAPESAEQIRAYDRAVLAAEQPLETTQQVPTPDGTLHVWQTYRFPFTARDGRRFLGGMAFDVTERYQLQHRLRESEERFRGAFDAAAIGMALVGLDGRFLQVNRSLCEIVGYSEDELLGLTFQIITHPDDLEADLSLVQQVLDGAIPNYSLEKRYIHKDGRIVWILLSVSLVRNTANEPLYFVSQIQDITRAREAERLKDEFVSTVSHELRTPLTSISGYVDLLLDGAAGEQSEEAQHFLTIVQQNGRRLIALVNDLLDMSRIEAGQIGLRREEIDLAAQLRGVVTAFAPQVAAKQQALLLQLPPSLPPIWADVQRTEQIFSNLVSNAHKYTPAGGAITVAVGTEVNAVRIDVSDTGIGLSDEEQANLFTRFFRAGNRAARAERGTGLGLVISRALAELHGGTIKVRSTPGQGSTFSVMLPLRESRPVQEEQPDGGSSAVPTEQRSAAPAPAGRLLVVEDDPDVGSLLREFLEQEGYEVRVVATAEQAVASVRGEPPDLITLDLKLPDADGWSVIDRLRAAGVSVPPVVVVSILPENGYGRPLGVVDYLAKPIRGSILRERVARALATRRSEDTTS
jgi:PAS domain S-box-containing protein